MCKNKLESPSPPCQEMSCGEGVLAQVARFEEAWVDMSKRHPLMCVFNPAHYIPGKGNQVCSMLINYLDHAGREKKRENICIKWESWRTRHNVRARGSRQLCTHKEN